VKLQYGEKYNEELNVDSAFAKQKPLKPPSKDQSSSTWKPANKNTIDFRELADLKPRESTLPRHPIIGQKRMFEFLKTLKISRLHTFRQNEVATLQKKRWPLLE